MKRKLWFMISFIFATSIWGIAQKSSTQEAQTPPAAPTTEEVSKALGVIYAGMLEDMMEKAPGGKEFKLDLVIDVMRDILLDKKKPIYDRSEANVLINKFFKKKQEDFNRRTRSESEKFLEENAKKEGVVTTKSGLQYLIIKEGKGIRPTVEDTVLVHYRGMLIDGTEFDSSIERGDPMKFNPLQVIPGWTEGLCLLNKGAKARFFIPSALAYGERGVGDIPPHSALIFDVELLDVIKGEPIPLAESSVMKPEEKQVTLEEKE